MAKADALVALEIEIREAHIHGGASTAKSHHLLLQQDLGFKWWRARQRSEEARLCMASVDRSGKWPAE